MDTRLSSRIGQKLVPIARLGVRHLPASKLRYALWKQFSWRRHDFIARTQFGSVMHGDTEDLIQRYIYYFGIWEPHLTAWISRRLDGDQLFVDVGANVGYFTLLGSHLLASGGRVVAIEASRKIYSQLLRNLELNGCKNVRTQCAAATAERCKVVTLYESDGSNLGSSTMVPGVLHSPTSSEVEGLPLSDMLTPEEVKRIRLIKIDVEGAEWDVLAGMHRILPMLAKDAELVIEISPHSLATQKRSVADILNIFRDAGFYPYFLVNDYEPEAYVFPGKISPPQRHSGPITRPTDVVFSRVDAKSL